MRSFSPSTLLLTAAGVARGLTVSNFNMQGSPSSWQYSTSQGGNAACVSGLISVSASASNVVLNVAPPANQSVTTEIFVEMQQSGYNYMAAVTGGAQPVSGTWKIWGKFCVPNNAQQANAATTLQFLTHGATLDHTYWDFAPGYSYVDAAAKAGYAVFLYDRLGTGLSDHPDPIQVVQSALEVEIAHQLVTALRAATYNGKSFKNVVGVGHSAGTTFTQGVTAKYPKDFDALIMSGTSASLSSLNSATASFDIAPASLDPSGRFKGYNNGYLTQGALPQAIQFAFWRFPYFDPNIFNKYVATKQTNTLGELLTLGSLVVPVPAFTGPVDVINGINDFVFCGGDCSYPTNQAQVYLSTFYPAAQANGSTTYLQPQAGHLCASHYSAQQGYSQMITFLQNNHL